MLTYKFYPGYSTDMQLSEACRPFFGIPHGLEPEISDPASALVRTSAISGIPHPIKGFDKLRAPSWGLVAEKLGSS